MTERPFGLNAKIVDVDGDSVILHTIDKNKRPRSRWECVYQNSDTRRLDERFGLTGHPIERDSALARMIYRSSSVNAIGDFSTSRVLMYFGVLAVDGGVFVGISEEEFRAYADTGHASFDFLSNTIDRAIMHNEGRGTPYLRRCTVEGTNVLFPANLQPQRPA